MSKPTKLPWYKRIFGIQPREVIYKRVISLRKLQFGRFERNISAALYEVINPETKEILEVYCEHSFGRTNFDVRAYQDGEYVMID